MPHIKLGKYLRFDPNTVSEWLLELLDALPEPSQSLAWLLALRWRDVDLEIGCIRVSADRLRGSVSGPG